MAEDHVLSYKSPKTVSSINAILQEKECLFILPNIQTKNHSVAVLALLFFRPQQVEAKFHRWSLELASFAATAEAYRAT